MNDDVLIVGSLKDDELRKSIDNLVDYVGTQTQVMANKFEGAMDIMKSAMKDFAITQNVSVNLMKQAWREMSSSFDAMVAAQTAATSSGATSGVKPTYADNTIGALEQEIALHEQVRKQTLLESDALREQNRIIEEKKKKLNEQKGLNTDQELIKKASKELGDAMSKSSSTLDLAKQKLAALEQVQRNYASGIGLSVKQQNRLTDAIERTKQKIEKLQATKPLTLVDAKMLPERSIDELSAKMKALRNVQTANAHEAKILGDEYQRLKRRQAELLGMNIQHTKSNNYLAQSFGYIRNRIVYALTLGAITSFTKQLYEIRGQYELLERSLGILINDMRRGSELFQELNEMALKSPFTLMELATGAKQLLAYNFAEEEVVDTTRRLADISAALGVPMERLVYNLGQIRAQTVLTARDARDFANAGLAIVPMLAKMYTDEKRFGDEIVTTSKVFDMMSDKMVSYGDVMKVINSVTDEGGKFFDFQAKQADTLRVKIANLTLSWNNMLNDIASSNQGLMTLPLNALKLLFENWRSVYEIVKDVIVLYGVYRASAMLVAMANSTIISQQFISGMFNLGRAVRFVVGAWRALSVAVAANPLGAMAIVVTSVATAFGLFNNELGQAVEYQNKFGDAGAKTVADLETYFATLSNISKESSNYTKVMGELNSILGEYNMELVSETDNQEQLNEKRRVSIQLIKEEILERKHLNEIEQGRKEYEAKVDSVREELRANLSDAITENFLGIGTVNDEIAKNAPAIANIIADVIENNIDAIADKTGDEYQKGVDKIFKEINAKMKAIGISEETRNKAWLENSPFRAFVDSNIIGNAIKNMVDAKRELDSYIESLDKAYETEKKAAENGAGFNDRVEQTQRRLMAAANDTDAFAKKVQTLLKDYGGQNVIDFLVKVQTQVPAWMSQKGLTELTRLSARFTALATNAKKAGKTSLNVNGKEFSVDQLFQRAAEYTQAAQNKAADIESRKSSKLTSEASNALNEYKSAIKAVNIAKNKLKQNTADQALVTEKETEAQKKYNEALKKGVSIKELEEAKNGKRKSGSKKDPLGDALAKEIQLITDIQKLYKEYQKAGVDADSARIASAKEYEKTLKTTNTQLSKYGIKGLTGEQLATMDLRELRDYYQSMLNIASKLNNAKGVEALEKALRGVNSEIVKVDYKKITDGLNNELGKLKDEYELAVELDANPELGDMFADMFGINTSTLPKTFGDALDRAQIIINRKLSEMNITTPFDLMEGNIDSFAKSTGLDKDSDVIKELVSAQNSYRDMFKKNITETEKILDDYIKKYGDYSDKIAEIEAGRLEKLKKLNEAYYTEEMRKRPEYVAKLNAIEQGASKEKQQVDFDEFKNSRYYTMMFENLDYISTKTIRDMRDHVRDLMDTMNNLTPEQLKILISQYEKLEQKLVKRSPFKNLTKDLKEYFATTKERKAANIEFKNAQNEYDAQKKSVAALKEKYEQAKANSNTSRSYLDFLQIEINGENEILKILKEQLDAAEKKADKYNLTAKLAKSEALAFANVVGQNIQSLGELRDFLQQDLGVELSDELNGLVDGLGKVGQGINKITSSATSGDVVGVITGVGQTVYGLYDGIASAFGGGSAGDKKITAQIKDSEDAIKRLENQVSLLKNAYDALSDAADHAFGTQKTGAEIALRSNQKLQLQMYQMQLIEKRRQLMLEQSRDGKNRDEDKIADLEGEIISLQGTIDGLVRDVAHAVEDITDELLGISRGSWAEELTTAMIDAFRAGEDYMQVFEDSWDDMVENMIMKLIVGRVIGDYMDKVFKSIDDIVTKNTEEYSDYLSNIQLTISNASRDDFFTVAKNLRDTQPDILGRAISELGIKNFTGNTWDLLTYGSQIKDWYLNYLQGLADKTSTSLQNATETATMQAYNDVLNDPSTKSGAKTVIETLPELLENLFGIKMGDRSNKNLSALQQGIQGITEDTAGALEGYMNGVSQQVYYHSDLLTQIRDVVVGMDMDIQVATQAQMLLQLQQSYAVQMAIQGILEGWNNPSGQAVRVELVS